MEAHAAGIGLLHSSAANCSGSIRASSLSPEKAALYKKKNLLFSLSPPWLKDTAIKCPQL